MKLLYPIPHPITGSVTVPGSKSYTNRALLTAALTKNSVMIEGPLVSDDTKAMISCLKTLGISLKEADDSIEVVGSIDSVADKEYNLDAHLSGITIRFLLALSCVLPGVQTLYGEIGLNKRPVRDLVDGLRQLGAHIEYLEKEGFPPVRVTSSRLNAGRVKMSGDVSSQYFSALLMIAPLIQGAMTIEVEGEQISRPYIDMTLDTMRQFGVVAENHNYKRYTVKSHQAYSSTFYKVEGDVSSASYFFAIAALTHSTITVHNLNPQSRQADMQFLEILAKMGSEIQYGDECITVRGHGVAQLDVDMEDCPDQAMTMAVLAAFAPGTTVIRGVQSLRVKETERVKAVEQELAKMGIYASSTHDTLTVHGGSPHGASIDTYGDHRMAMSFAIAGMCIPEVRINHPEVVGKTFPGFWRTLEEVIS